MNHLHERAGHELRQLTDEVHQAMGRANPLEASVFGVAGFDDALPDLSAEGEAATARELSDLADRVESVAENELSRDDQITRAVILQTVRAKAGLLGDRHAEFAVSGPWSALALLFTGMSSVTGTGEQAEQDLVSRTEAIPRYIRELQDRALVGAATGRGATRRGVQQSLERVRSYLDRPVDEDPLVMQTVGTAVHDTILQLVSDRIRPAFVDLEEAFAGAVLDGARSDDRSGVVHLRDGGEVYARAIEAHTTTSRTPEEFHQMGLEMLGALREEFAEMGQAVLGTRDFDEIVTRLRDDPALRYDSAESILSDARNAAQRAHEAMGDWFVRAPRVECRVEPIEAMMAKRAEIGQYVPPSLTAGSPGRYQVNTHLPHTRARFEYETLAFHEGTPGHHVQFAAAQELDHIPPYRRYLYIPAFGEGWGLYAERLADEMQLYSNELSRFGMLSFDAKRASRLVVDTGLHHFGWSRDQAMEFMLSHCAGATEGLINEVDRFVAWPGQALSYMTGRTEIQSARAAAQARLGARFDIKGFHDVVLGNGAVPMAVLRDEVARWAEREIERAG